ncbi:MAG: hypothetical protein EPN62_00130 [Candidimonas sp.]|nr:MAG: hypothetical protein EPN62_00130 [Candidimonas sp.]
MSRPRKEDCIAEEDLAWFKLDNYAGLRGANTNVWAQVILDRANLRLLFQTPENIDSVRELFTKLQANPLQSLGFEMNIPKRHEVDTETVKLLTVDRVHALSYEFADIQLGAPSGTNAVDDLLRTRDNAARPFTHLSIDLRATDAQLQKDFKSLIKEWRKHAGNTVTMGDYQNKLVHWHIGKIIPYFDLCFYARLHKRTIRRETYAKFLELGNLVGGPAKDKLDGLLTSTTQVVSFKNFHALRTLDDAAVEAPIPRP